MIAPGAQPSGQVAAAAAAPDTLELQAGADTLSGIGTQFTNFRTLRFDPGAQ